MPDNPYVFVVLLFIFIGIVTFYALPILRHDIWTEYDTEDNCIVKIRRYGKYGRIRIDEFLFERIDGRWRYRICWKRLIPYTLATILMILLFSRHMDNRTTLMLVIGMALFFTISVVLAPVFAYLYMKHEEDIGGSSL